MARRIRFAIAQPVIIVGWFISSALLIAILIPFGVFMYRPENSNNVYTQAYFYGAFAAGMYFVIACLMMVTAYGARVGHYSREYKLSNSQRTLMLQTIIFCIYLVAGAAVYSKVEDWRFLDSVYFVDYTLRQLDVFAFRVATQYQSLIPARKSSDEKPVTVALLGPSNFEYLVTLLALFKLGHTCLFLSTRISQAAVDNLVKGTEHDLWEVNAESVYHEEEKQDEQQPYIEAPETKAQKEPLHR